MKEIIDRIYKRTTEYSHPSQATTIANSLELLSSGIYTEEERFVFELLQNAVDSCDEVAGGLDVKIIIGNGRLVFMHNGKAFSERDLEGLCDIGNGNKMNDAKKIGYKGIGFKSVFMHSKRVTVITDDTCFRFDEAACKALSAELGKEYYNVKMPWQIIPIISEIPIGIDYSHYNVTTILEVSNTEKLLKKVHKLLSDARFLLFLKVSNLKVSLFDINNEILTLSKTQDGNILTLAKNNIPQTRWLMFAEDVTIPTEVKEDLNHDAKTPSKLKESDSVEISFAISLDDEGHIVPLKDAVIYTYLPTSFSFGFDFIVNANFITDAGRQQLIKDCDWNKFIFSQIPILFLNWIKDEVAPNHKDWYKILLPLTKDSDELSVAYSSNMDYALQTIPFVRSMTGKQTCISQALFDKFSFHNSLPSESFCSFIKHELNISEPYESIVPTMAGKYLLKYGISVLGKSHIEKFLQNSIIYLKSLKDEEYIVFAKWLKDATELRSSSFDNILSYSHILPCEDGELHEPIKVFFYSEYMPYDEIVGDAFVLRSSFGQAIPSDLTSWLKELGVQEMSKISIINKVICEADYITKDNAIKALTFVFKANQQDNIFGSIPSHRLENLKLLTTGGNLRYASELYLSDIYNPVCKLQKGYRDDIFVTDLYLTNYRETSEWMLFFKKLGVNDDVSLLRIKYGEGSWPMRNYRISSLVSLAKNTEYNPWGTRKYYLGCGGPVSINVNSSPLLNPYSNHTHEFYENFWGRIFSQPFVREQENIYGPTGYGWSKTVSLSSSKYLGQTFVDWILMTFKVIPASDKQLYTINDVLINSKSNKDLFGKYFPVISINGIISDEWLNRLPLKKDLSLNDYLNILDNISKDDEKEQINDNIQRITRIYDRIADEGYDLTEDSYDFNILRVWGKTHKILSSEKEFEYPCDLCLISSRLSGVDLDNQVYHRKNQENDRFASLMIALGVNMITDHRVEGLENAVSQNSINESLLNKKEFFATLTLNGETSKQKWDEAVEKMHASISAIRFYGVSSIQVIYGKQSIEKAVYVSNSNLYFVGKFGLAVQELLHDDIVRLIGLHKNDSSTFLTLMRMRDFDEMIEYLKLKGYSTQYISCPMPLEKTVEDPNAVMKGEDAPNGELSNEQKRVYLEEAKDAILLQLSCDGFDTSNYKWDGWTCIDGVKKDGKEYPLVIRSNKSGRNTVLSASDWDQLMKKNAMFVVNTNSGIGTVNFKQLLRSKDNITIRFGSENIDEANRISKLAEAFAFFKGMQFDFESYIRPTISRWQSFMAPELETGEQAVANPSIPLPE